MLLVLSPSKTLDYTTDYGLKTHSQPQFLPDSEVLVKKLRGMTQAQVGRMMEISETLAALNVQRFADFHTPFTLKNARQALLAFKGDVYSSIPVAEYTQDDFAFAQGHVRIVSGLYGLLRPLDLIQPYRLEMGRRLAVGKNKDLYGFWGNRIAGALAAELAGHRNKLLINLASVEYARAIDRKALGAPVLDIIFKEKQKDSLKIVALFAKQARGAMANFIVRNQIDNPVSLQDFTWRGYQFQPKFSGDAGLVFVRKTS